jgi:assimilatory nitrate reductase catalytic subunit
VQWPVRRAGEDSERLFGDGRFLTPTGRARFVAIKSAQTAAEVSETWPFVLNTGRVRDQWHTMTRTGLSARLAAHVSEPFVEMHPDDAAALGLEQGMLARVETEHGAALLRVMPSEGQQPGSVFVPIHWSAENSSAGRIGALVQSLHGSRTRVSPTPRPRQPASSLCR